MEQTLEEKITKYISSITRLRTQLLLSGAQKSKDCFESNRIHWDPVHRWLESVWRCIRSGEKRIDWKRRKLMFLAAAAQKRSQFNFSPLSGTLTEWILSLLEIKSSQASDRNDLLKCYQIRLFNQIPSEQCLQLPEDVWCETSRGSRRTLLPGSAGLPGRTTSWCGTPSSSGRTTHPSPTEHSSWWWTFNPVLTPIA